jgi:hypothetical protein
LYFSATIVDSQPEDYDEENERGIKVFNSPTITLSLLMESVYNGLYYTIFDFLLMNLYMLFEFIYAKTYNMFDFVED